VSEIERLAADHPEVKLTMVTRPIKGVNDLKAPSYSCRACEEGRHDRCAGTEYDISWSFVCTCGKNNQHFERVEVVEIPVNVFPGLIAEARAKALEEAASSLDLWLAPPFCEDWDQVQDSAEEAARTWLRERARTTSSPAIRATNG
jgi:hypothetical protein